MIEEITYDGEGFKGVKEFEGWRIGYVHYSERFSKLGEMEKHLESDEVHILLEGTARLYTDQDSCEMKKNVVYNIPKGIWHHIVVSQDATVLIVENSNTSRENTEKKLLNSKA
ncbi:MAG: hypothetical protein IKA09_10100 [Lachnospiraceae bacterium]|nr:hypothetical protein [Lachnospiraceae bacterium]